MCTGPTYVSQGERNEESRVSRKSEALRGLLILGIYQGVCVCVALPTTHLSFIAGCRPLKFQGH